MPDKILALELSAINLMTSANPFGVGQIPILHVHYVNILGQLLGTPDEIINLFDLFSGIPLSGDGASATVFLTITEAKLATLNENFYCELRMASGRAILRLPTISLSQDTLQNIIPFPTLIDFYRGQVLAGQSGQIFYNPTEPYQPGDIQYLFIVQNATGSLPGIPDGFTFVTSRTCPGNVLDAWSISLYTSNTPGELSTLGPVDTGIHVYSYILRNGEVLQQVFGESFLTAAGVNPLPNVPYIPNIFPKKYFVISLMAIAKDTNYTNFLPSFTDRASIFEGSLRFDSRAGDKSVESNQVAFPQNLISGVAAGAKVVVFTAMIRSNQYD